MDILAFLQCLDRIVGMTCVVRSYQNDVDVRILDASFCIISVVAQAIFLAQSRRPVNIDIHGRTNYISVISGQVIRDIRIGDISPPNQSNMLRAPRKGIHSAQHLIFPAHVKLPLNLDQGSRYAIEADMPYGFSYLETQAMLRVIHSGPPSR